MRNSRLMKVIQSLFLVLAFVVVSNAQKTSTTGNSVFDRKWIRNGTTEMGYYSLKGGDMTEICSFVIDIKSTAKTLSVYTTLTFLHSGAQWKDTCVSDINTFKPMYRSSHTTDRDYVLQFGNEVTGTYFDKKTKKTTVVNDPTKEFFVDSYTYPYLLGLLPLTSGYRTELSVYDYKPENKSHVKKARIEEVKNNVYVSSLTGEHKVWQVSVLEEASNDKYEYHIDKDTRRIWKIEIFSGTQQLMLLDKEIDFNPFTTTFDKEATMKLIKSGSAVISGQAFAKDNENEGLLSGMAVLNVNKKQYAPKGTSIILIPYTAFFKEWLKLNEASRKKGRAIPLPAEVAECMKVASVYDDEGSFEFVNLMPGEYMLYTEFGYTHTTSRTEVVGYTDTYINGIFQGSSANTETYSYGTNASASIQKVVEIREVGENVSVRLKKTR